MTLHLTQIFFTDARTFILTAALFSAHPADCAGLKNLLIAVHNPSAIQVVWAQFYCHSIPGENTNEILPHSARDVSQNLMPLFELDLEHGVRQGLDDRCHYFNRVFFRQTCAPALLLFVDGCTLRRQNRCSGVSYRHRMLKMSAHAAIIRYSRPAIFQNPNLRLAGIHHRLNRNHHARF